MLFEARRLRPFGHALTPSGRELFGRWLPGSLTASGPALTSEEELKLAVTAAATRAS